jgi:hypothetical protein
MGFWPLNCQSVSGWRVVAPPFLQVQFSPQRRLTASTSGLRKKPQGPQAQTAEKIYRG